MKELVYEVIRAGKIHVNPNTVFNWSKAWGPVQKEGVPRPYLPLNEIESYFKSSEKPFCMYITSDYPHGPYFDVDGKTADDSEQAYSGKSADRQNLSDTGKNLWIRQSVTYGNMDDKR